MQYHLRVQELRLDAEKTQQEIAFEENYVSYAKTGSFLLKIPEILDYADLRLNGDVSNIVLEPDEIPILGGVTIE